MAEQIILATDGGPASESALAWIADRANHTKLAVEVVSVEELEWLPVGADLSTYQARYFTVLSAAKATLSRHAGISGVATTLLTGDPAEALTVAGAVADLLVVGSPRSRDDHGALHGTLALRVAAHATGNVIIVPAGWQPRGGAVVVGIDEDGSSDAAVIWAGRQAAQMKRDLVLVHCWSLPAPLSVLDDLLGTTYPTLERIHQNILDDTVRDVKRRHPHLAVSSELRFGNPAAELANIATAEAMVVVGHHKRGLIEHVFLGSVGHDVLLATPTVTAVIPARETANEARPTDSVIGGPDVG